MSSAMIQFFPEASNSASMADLTNSPDFSKDKDRVIQLQRIVTGASIVGEGNGERPGGFVLVVDGAALLEVRHISFMNIQFEPTINNMHRPLLMRKIKHFYSGWPHSAKG
jgi:hypothetical protein